MLALPEHLQLLVDPVPTTWNGPHVGLRLVEAMRTLLKLPLGRRQGFSHSWPDYAYEWQDLVAQAESPDVIERAQRLQNHTRFLPSRREVSHMDRALGWSTTFLRERTELARAVNSVALVHAMDRDIRWIVRRRGGDIDTWRQRHAEGCAVVAAGLRATRTPVF
jgi:hypothetical protein